MGSDAMNSDKKPRESAAQRVFGPQAGVYASSPVHVDDPSLDVVREMAAQTPGINYAWALDLGTGAGFTAFAMAEFSRHVLAVDPTLGMLQQAQRIAEERHLSNVALSRNVAEALPVAPGSLDLVTTRMAAHHFLDFEVMLDEVCRVLKSGGVLLLADSVAPEDSAGDDTVARWMNDIELRRDYSHIQNRKASYIESLMEDRGLRVSEREYTRIGLRFNDWTARTATSDAETYALRMDFLAASTPVKEAFQIYSLEGDDAEDISFSWPCVIFRAVKE